MSHMEGDNYAIPGITSSLPIIINKDRVTLLKFFLLINMRISFGNYSNISLRSVINPDFVTTITLSPSFILSLP